MYYYLRRAARVIDRNQDVLGGRAARRPSSKQSRLFTAPARQSSQHERLPVAVPPHALQRRADGGCDRVVAACSQIVCLVRILRQVPLHLVDPGLFPQMLWQPEPSARPLGSRRGCRRRRGRRRGGPGSLWSRRATSLMLSLDWRSLFSEKRVFGL